MLKINKFRKVNPSKRRRRIMLFFKISLWGFVIGFSLGIISGYLIGKKEREDKDQASNYTKSTEIINWNGDWDYASLSQIHESSATLYHSNSSKPKNITVALNAGHGTVGGENVQIPCHPDGSVYVNEDGSLSDVTFTEAVTAGQTLNNDLSEDEVMLSIALQAKTDLLKAGYDVLMIRESEDCRLDNIARTVLANENADCLITFHCDSEDSDKGMYYIGVLQTGAYLSMDPVAARWLQHDTLGDAMMAGARKEKLAVYKQTVTMDLVQTSYAKIPAVCLETGDKDTSFSDSRIRKIAKSITDGMDVFLNSTD